MKATMYFLSQNFDIGLKFNSLVSDTLVSLSLKTLLKLRSADSFVYAQETPGMLKAWSAS